MSDISKNYLVVTEKPTLAKDISNAIKDVVFSGDVDELALWLQGQRIKAGIDLAFKDANVKEAIADSFAKHLEGKSAKLNDAVITEAATYTKYDYVQCGHTELDFIDTVINSLTGRKKDIETELKLIKDGRTKDIIMDNHPIDIIKDILETSIYEPGEIVTCIQPTKYQTMGLKVKGK